MRWELRELNQRRASQNVTGHSFRLNHLAKGAVHITYILTTYTTYTIHALHIIYIQITYYTGQEGTYHALGMAGIEPTSSKSECDWTPLSP